MNREEGKSMRCNTSLSRFGLISLSFLLSILVGPNSLVLSQQEGRPERASQARAVSFKVLQQRAKACMATGECPKEVLQLCGLTKVSCFIVDQQNMDLVFVGNVASDAPALFLEDFVISLRNAWWKYAPLRGNTYYYSAPGCSIDPKQETFHKLQKIGLEIISASGEMETIYQEWQSICSEPQNVVVLGVPFNTRFARVTVEADYYMKRLVNGSVSLGIEGLESLTDLTLNAAKEDVLHNRSVSMPVSTVNRFWFFPGENRYVEDEGVVCVNTCEVKLLTEEEFLTRKGELAGTGRPNLLAQEFSQNFTIKYREIAQRRPIYAELESLFRFVALAQIMKFKDSIADSGLKIDYLLNLFPIKSISLVRTLPGLSHMKGFEHRREIPGGYQIAKLQFPSCGGVSIDIRVSKKDFSSDRTGKLRKFRQAVLRARPSQNALHWDVPAVDM